jgi:hypothetical protein
MLHQSMPSTFQQMTTPFASPAARARSGLGFREIISGLVLSEMASGWTRNEPWDRHAVRRHLLEPDELRQTAPQSNLFRLQGV